MDPKSDARGLDRFDRFLETPGDQLSDWRALWELDRTFPVRSHRPFFGKLIVGLKRLLRPLVRSPQADLWERQRLFNLVLLAHLDSLRENVSSLGADLQEVRQEILRDLREVRDDLVSDLAKNHGRISHLEDFKRDGLKDVMDHSDALYALLDQRLDRVRRNLDPLKIGLAKVSESIEQSED